MLPFFPEDDPVKDGVIDFVLFPIFVGFLGTTILASYEALPVSPPFSRVLLSRCPMLA